MNTRSFQVFLIKKLPISGLQTGSRRNALGGYLIFVLLSMEHFTSGFIFNYDFSSFFALR